MKKMPKFSPLCRWPGDTAVRLTHDAIDASGRKWAKGTMFGCVLSRGTDNTRPGAPEYCVVTAGPSGNVRFVAAE